jgi:predicted DNA-binding transcriptional regulator AlpA
MRFLTKKQVREITTLSFAEIARREAAGMFPQRRRLSEYPNGRVVYVEEVVLGGGGTVPVRKRRRSE